MSEALIIGEMHPTKEDFGIDPFGTSTSIQEVALAKSFGPDAIFLEEDYGRDDICSVANGLGIPLLRPKLRESLKSIEYSSALMDEVVNATSGYERPLVIVGTLHVKQAYCALSGKFTVLHWVTLLDSDSEENFLSLAYPGQK